MKKFFFVFIVPVILGVTVALPTILSSNKETVKTEDTNIRELIEEVKQVNQELREKLAQANLSQEEKVEDVNKQASETGYNTDELQKVLSFTYFEQYDKTIVLTHYQSADVLTLNDKVIAEVSNLLFKQKEEGDIKDFQVVTGYSGNYSRLSELTIILYLK